MFAAQEPCPAEMLVMSSAGDDGNPKRGMGISKDEIAARKAQQVCVCVCVCVVWPGRAHCKQGPG